MRRIGGCLLTVACLSLTGADWTAFRGGDKVGVAPKEDLPTNWSEGENVAWSAELPGKGLAAPIIVGDRVIITAASGYRSDRLHVICFSAKTGKTVWERKFWATGRTMTHPRTNVAAPSPVSDGKHIVALYSTNDIFCLDMDGNLLWARGLTVDYPNAGNSLGMASSPVIAGDTVVAQIESDSDAFAVGLSLADGKNRWKLERPRSPNWTTPIVLKPAGGPEVVVMQCSKRLTAHDPSTGKDLWTWETGCNTIPSSAFDGETFFVPANGMTAVQPVAGGGEPKVLWKNQKLAPATGSPVAHDGRVYSLNKTGVVTAGDAKTGEVLWQLRLKGSFSASPLITGDHMYVVNEEGLCQVVKLAADKGEIVGAGDLKATVLGTPAIANGALYVRSDGQLWKIAKPSGATN